MLLTSNKNTFFYLTMISQFHQAAQYLAGAGISFIKKADDDSHTNLGWDSSSHRLLTHPFTKKNFQLGLNFDTFDLEWLQNGFVQAQISLTSHTHAEVLNWIHDQVKHNDINATYHYKFHYELPYDDLAADHIFEFDQQKASVISEQWDIAQLKFAEFLNECQLHSPIRVWPHHFDMGIYTRINTKPEAFLGAGYAIPDDWINDFYYYANGWLNNQPVTTANFSTISHGIWHKKDHKGLTYNQQNVNDKHSNIDPFLRSALKGFKAAVN